MAGPNGGQVARRAGSTVVGLVLIALGIVFLVGQYLNVDLGRGLWPFFIILPGLAFFVAMVAIGESAAGLAIPGSVVTTVGLILLYQNTTRHWQSWAYAWTLIIVAVGIGLAIQGAWSNRSRLRESGRRVATVGGVLFLVFLPFFELAGNISGAGGAGQWLWPLALIAAGLAMLVRQALGSRR